jgi:type IV pilus assembly protein PilM
VGYEASQQIPFPLDEVIWDYHLVSREYLTGEEREVGIFAVRREAIDDYLLDFTNEGLAVEMLSIGYLGLLNYILYDIAPPEPSIVVDIGATHTDLILVEGKKFWIRALPHSGNDVNKAIMERFKVSFHEAEKLKIDSAKAPQQAVKIFSAVIQPKLKDLVGEIHRSVGYYRSQAGEVKFQNLYLLGNGSRVVGIKKYLTEQLGVQVHRVQTLRHFRVNREVDLKLLQNELPAFATAFGCALQGVGAGSCQVDLVPQEERVQKDLKRKKKHAIYASAILFVAIGLAYLILNQKIQAAREVARSHRTWLDTNITKWEREAKNGKVDVPGLSRSIADLERIGEIRSLVIAGLRNLGAVLPAANEKTEVVVGDLSKKAELEAEAKTKISELNRQKLWIPWLKIERVEWPEVPPDAAGKARDEKKKGPPTVPAYKVTALAAVQQQGDDAASLSLLRKLIEEAVERRLKEGNNLTIDPEVKVSQEFVKDLQRLYHVEQGSGANVQLSEVRAQRLRADDTPQEAAPFFATKVSWYLRLKEPKEEVQVAAKEKEENEEEAPKKTGRPPKRPPKK